MRGMPLFALSLFSAGAPASVDIFTVPDDPSTAESDFADNVQGSYAHQGGNSRTSTLSADSTLTWFDRATLTASGKKPTTTALMTPVPPRNIRRACACGITWTAKISFSDRTGGMATDSTGTEAATPR